MTLTGRTKHHRANGAPISGMSTGNSAPRLVVVRLDT